MRFPMHSRLWFPVRHGMALAAAIVTVLLFASEGRGRTAGLAPVRATGQYVVEAAALHRIDLELSHQTGLIDMRRAIRDGRSGAIDDREFGDDALVFAARLTTTLLATGEAETELADCTWSDVSRTSADCTVGLDGDEGATFSLTVIRGAPRNRDVQMRLSRPAATPFELPVDTPLTLVW